jgi:hypothetical protein
LVGNSNGICAGFSPRKTLSICAAARWFWLSQLNPKLASPPAST